MDKDIIKPKVIKLGILGDVPVGKTAICEAFVNYNSNEQIMCYGNLEKIIKLKNNEDIKIVIWDNSGQERYRSIAISNVKCAHGIILIFDVTKKTSFDNLPYWIESIKENICKPFIILFANKIDLPKDKWEATSEEISEFAQRYELVYFETSAITKKGIMEGISYIANEIYVKIENKNNIIIKEKDTKKINRISNCVKSKQKKGK